MSDIGASPVFVCGHRKTGTTMLLNLFDSHPQICAFPPDSGFWYAWYPLFDDASKSDEEKKQRVIDTLFYNFKTDLEGLDCWDDSTMSYPWDKLNARFIERMDGKECTGGNLLDNAIQAYRDICQAECGWDTSNYVSWLEKTTSTEIYANAADKWFPNAKYIHLLRDPRDNYGSLKSGWSARYAGQNDSVERLLQSMLDRGLLGMKYASVNQERFGKDKYKVIRYEDLCSKPEEVMADLCEFIGIKYDDILMKPTYFGLPWKGNNFDGLKFDKPSAVNCGRWRERIDDYEAQIIEFHFREEMKHWGYDLEFSAVEAGDAASEHYKWFNYAQQFSVLEGANTYPQDNEEEKTD
ncbi:MAG: sulfotransferase [Candidatus Lindowbacteria bacterium]|nr:sulfotransferase [Candidatus Lindowbacteria bacterium]